MLLIPALSGLSSVTVTQRRRLAMTHPTDLLTAARAEALFTSDLSAHAQPSATEIAAAIRHAVRRHGGSRGCAANVAQAYGERPENAAPRMRWARQLVSAAYPVRGGTTGSHHEFASHP
jgi:hypothetical protein